jgi:hypothetical protein
MMTGTRRVFVILLLALALSTLIALVLYHGAPERGVLYAVGNSLNRLVDIGSMFSIGNIDCAFRVGSCDIL